jgi:hypothetical protein
VPVECPPRTGPGRMRVLREPKTEDQNEGKEAHAGADHPEAEAG